MFSCEICEISKYTFFLWLLLQFQHKIKWMYLTCNWFITFGIGDSKVVSFYRIVSGYLVHHGYSSTADCFAKATGQSISEELSSVRNRQSEDLLFYCSSYKFEIVCVIMNGVLLDSVDCFLRYFYHQSWTAFFFLSF